MGMCKPSGGISSVVARRLDDVGDANTRIDRYNEKGELVQQRWYGPDGQAIWDRDWSHNNSNHSHTFPHDHSWDWNKLVPRQKVVPKNENFC